MKEPCSNCGYVSCNGIDCYYIDDEWEEEYSCPVCKRDCCKHFMETISKVATLELFLKRLREHHEAQTRDWEARIKHLEANEDLLLSCYEETEFLRRLVKEMVPFVKGAWTGESNTYWPDYQKSQEILNHPEVREITEKKDDLT